MPKKQKPTIYRVLNADGEEIGGSNDVAGLVDFADKIGGAVVSPTGTELYASPAWTAQVEQVVQPAQIDLRPFPDSSQDNA